MMDVTMRIRVPRAFASLVEDLARLNGASPEVQLRRAGDRGPGLEVSENRALAVRYGLRGRGCDRDQLPRARGTGKRGRRMSDYTVSELRDLCDQIRERSRDGNNPPEITGKSEEEVWDLLCYLLEAAHSLQEMAHILLACRRIAFRIRTDEEMDEEEKRERFDRLTKGPVQGPTATADDLPDFFGESAT